MTFFQSPGKNPGFFYIYFHFFIDSDFYISINKSKIFTYLATECVYVDTIDGIWGKYTVYNRDLTILCGIF